MAFLLFGGITGGVSSVGYGRGGGRFLRVVYTLCYNYLLGRSPGSENII